ncbi:hypothetical protein HCBG_05304 [Histoplasma capsulatum G186AR]|uniref:Type 1 phosphatases regulator n=2 Tax=Ajellomyces capsulatus TaxID=5037 RepID=C0NQM4_AJECG|nr:uncharacterized protein HCBG_05304 [Histoplasma capsulatum G186AR]EEH05988.1 hypothetical protein HCBG_05304 [Histoplasma capsulatum G186AR]KAG5293554.1 hypothetical protein I7I52_04905 [Histoplasma capsulatum]QSS75005.1 hypothetical protein I7I50_03997 [Histoplasma capsulatum G186AR]
MSRDRGAMTQRLRTAGATSSTSTITQGETTGGLQQQHQQQRQFIITGRLRLRAEADNTAETASGTGTDQVTRRSIRWAEDVVDNEGLGRKSSKVCCIYHKARPVGESSSESSSDSSSDSGDSDSDSDADTGEARMASGRLPANRMHCHQHRLHDTSSSQQDGPSGHEGCDDSHAGTDSDNCCDSGSSDANKRRQIQIHRQHRQRRPNAYERMPKFRSKKKE